MSGKKSAAAVRSERSAVAGDAAHHVIESMEVTAGFLKGMRIDYVDGLNTTIGERGTGKTTQLELVRFALGMDTKCARGVVQANLGNGRVRLRIRTKHGVRYVVERAWGEAPQVFNEAGEPVAVSFERNAIFKADVYSQNEIEKIATSPALQLELIDKFDEEAVLRAGEAIERCVRALAANAAELLRVGREVDALQETAAERTAVEEKLRELAPLPGPGAEALAEGAAAKALRGREAQALALLARDLEENAEAMPRLAVRIAERIGARVDEELVAGPHRRIFQTVADRVEALTRAITHVAAETEKAFQDAAALVAEAEDELRAKHAKHESEYRSLLEKSEEESSRASERAAVERRMLEIAAAEKELEAKCGERRALTERRAEMLDELSRLRDERFELRRRVAEDLTARLAGMVRVSVVQAGRRDAYRDLVAEILKGAFTRPAPVADRIVLALAPGELAAAAARGDAERIASRVGLDGEKARKVLEMVASGERRFQVEVVAQEDSPKLELLDGSSWKESTGLSTGQRCTVVLPILLLESERPLLIDQPEDNLDNKFIYEAVMKSVRGVKASRQLIFVTHNPNIPVLGNADRVFVMGSDGRQGHVAKSGTVDALKAEIERILEGGREAFRLRKECYGQ